MPRRRTLTRPALALSAGLFVALAPLVPAQASAPAYGPKPADAGDLWPDVVAWTDEQGLPVQVLTPGKKARMKYTVKNLQSYPLKVTGVDTQVTADQCAADVKRASSKTNPFNMLPVYLMPGEKSGELYDEWFTLSPSSTCSQVTLNWVANGIAEKTTTPFPSPKTTAAPMPTVTPVAPTPSIVPATSVTTDARPPSVSASPKPIDPGEGQGRDPMPLLIGGGVALLTLLLGLALLLRGRR